MEELLCTIKEAEEFFRHNSRSIVAEKTDGTRKEVANLEEAKEFLGEQQLLTE